MWNYVLIVSWYAAGFTWSYNLFLAVFVWISTCHDATIIPASLWTSFYWMWHRRSWSNFRARSILILSFTCQFTYLSFRRILAHSWFLLCFDQLGDTIRLAIPNLDEDEVNSWLICLICCKWNPFCGIINWIIMVAAFKFLRRDLFNLICIISSIQFVFICSLTKKKE